MSSSSSPIVGKNQMYYGGDGGGFHPVDIGESAGRMITIYKGEVIDAIQIGDRVYGRDSGKTDGGKLKVVMPLPESAYFTITKLVKRIIHPEVYFRESKAAGMFSNIGIRGSSVVTYLEAEIDGKQVKVGDQTSINNHGVVDNDATWTGNEKVAIAGVQCGTFVDGILFQKAAK